MSFNKHEKVEVGFNQATRLRLIKTEPFIGTNDYGRYYRYDVLDLGDDKEKSFFAPDYLHEEMKEKGLAAGKEFAVKKVPFKNNGKPSSRIELSVNGAASPRRENHQASPKLNFRDIMLECLKDAVEIVNSVKEVPFQTNDIRSIAATLFIAKVKQWNYREGD